MKHFKDLTSKRFGKLVVTVRNRVEYKDRFVYMWACWCDCGNWTLARTIDLEKGRYKSCGCYKKENPPVGRPPNPSSNHRQPEYHNWQSMKSRCLNKNEPNYHRYGGRGITICERWLNSFKDFLADLGPKPSPRHTLERINNHGNYEPSNVRWATRKEQAQNRELTERRRIYLSSPRSKHGPYKKHTT